MFTDRGAQLIRDCEKALRELVGEAAAAGEYEAVLQMTSWARELASLVTQRVPETGAVSTPGKQFKQPATTSASLKHSPKAAYPKFLRRGDYLVKVGWSKHDKKEYQHKAPRSVLLKLASVIAKVSVDGRILSTESILPLHDPNADTPVPDYQAYVALAFLKHIGIVKQHGRQGYSVPNIANLNQAAETAWNTLTTR